MLPLVLARRVLAAGEASHGVDDFVERLVLAVRAASASTSPSYPCSLRCARVKGSCALPVGHVGRGTARVHAFSRVKNKRHLDLFVQLARSPTSLQGVVDVLVTGVGLLLARAKGRARRRFVE